MLKEAEDELSKMIRSVKSKLQEDAAEHADKAAMAQELKDLEGVLARLRIVKLLITSILALKYSGKDCLAALI